MVDLDYYWFLIGFFWPIIFISIGISIFCAKKKGVAERKTPHKGTSSVKKSNLDSDKPNQSSQAEPTPKKEKSKSKSKHLDSKQKKSLKKEPSKVNAEGKTDPFEAADGDDEEGGGGATGKDRTETSQKCQSKSKKRGGKGNKLGLPNKDGYDDLNPNKKDDEDMKSKMKTEETKSKMQQKDDGYDAIDPTKNVNLENVNMNESNGNDKAASPVNKPNKPRQIPRDAKQQKIAKGAKKGKGDYPTFDDVISDWDSKKESVGAPGGAAGGAAAGGGIGEKSKGQSKVHRKVFLILV
uniref:Uncharacterized protein n=1 Tax=Panagrolaimus superbus TaxID=310955 RepID=A0A914XSE1_9BILA